MNHPQIDLVKRVASGELLDPHTRVCPLFNQLVAIHRHFYADGWHLFSGIQYGGHFALYDNAERMGHSKFIVRVISHPKEFMSGNLLAFARAVFQAKKKAIISWVDDETGNVFVRTLKSTKHLRPVGSHR